MQLVETVTKGQPDKVCDQIADTIVDEYLRRDPNARVSLNVLGSHGAIMIGGEVVSAADFDVAALVKKVYSATGYFDEIEPFVNLDIQSPSPLQKTGLEPRSMAILTGYATNVTPEMLPRPLVLAQALAHRLDDLRLLDPEFAWLRPDGKVHVGMERDTLKLVVVSVQHDESVEDTFVRTRLVERVLTPMLHDLDGARVLINHHGAQTRGGFQVATGLTGRKLSSDTYGGLIPWPGGALSGKDPSNVDRAGAYMARFAAKNLVASGAGKSALVQMAYVRGEEQPVYLVARTGEGKDLTEVLKKRFDFRLEAIVERLDLRKPRYQHTACYGHFGRNEFPWEKIENV